MKFRLLCVLFAVIFALAACGNNGTNNDANNDNNGTNRDDNVEHTRFNSHANDDNRIDNGDRHDDRIHMGNDSNDDLNNRYDVSKKAADRIMNEVAGIDRAHVFTTDNNAYVAAGSDENDGDGTNMDNNHGVNDEKMNDNTNSNPLDNGHALTDEKKREIQEIVKSVEHNVDHVYVSTNPDFFNLANDHAGDVRNGKSDHGFFDQFGNMIDRIFPQHNR
ncbi:YhcN/YlaJ family sporulation lipoprotein [Lentibacillus sp. N15]|uniref:YhcN/YlaJ family sporulation lipoprotein n=1 Tax=Lentibacillus songyuanensis TaxID=3136161 RepID=UPI0031BB26F1